MKTLIWIALLVSQSFAMDVPGGSITYVTSPLPMSQKELKGPRDYYVDLGRRDGLKEGDILSVKRVMPILGQLGGAPTEFLFVPIGELKVYWVGEESTITRALEMPDTVTLPWLEYYDFCVGDRVELKRSLPTGERPT